MLFILFLKISYQFCLQLHKFAIFSRKSIRLLPMAMTHNFKPTISLEINSFHSSPIRTTPLIPLKLSKNSVFSGTTLSVPVNYDFTRKRIVPSVSGLWDAVTGGSSGREALIAIRRGMQLFREVNKLGDMILCMYWYRIWTHV